MSRQNPEGYENTISELQEDIDELKNKIKRLKQQVHKFGDLQNESLENLNQMKEMVEIEPASFLMNVLEGEGDNDTAVSHYRVTLTRKFSVGKYQVTQGLWESVMGSNPSGRLGMQWSGRMIRFMGKCNGK
jgi:formylglycine-generating enzyme required for sulfatase activity